jgi:hypothetical protein
MAATPPNGADRQAEYGQPRDRGRVVLKELARPGGADDVRARHQGKSHSEQRTEPIDTLARIRLPNDVGHRLADGLALPNSLDAVEVLR